MKTTYNYEGTVAANLVEDKDIVNDLTTGGANKVLSAEQGKTLKGLIDSSTSDEFDSLKAKLEKALFLENPSV